MLALPFLVGIVLGGLSWLHVPLALAWFTGYVASYYLMVAVKTRRWRRVVPQLLAFGVPALVAGLLVAVARPYLLLVIPVIVLVLGLSALAARKHRDRRLVNDYTLVLFATLMVPISASVNQDPEAALSALIDRPVLVGAFLVFGYLGGAVLHVKGMIRERANPRIRRASLLWSLGALLGVLLVLPWAAPLYALFAARTWWLPRHRMSPLQLGLIEIACSVGVFVVAWLLLPGMPGTG